MTIGAFTLLLLPQVLPPLVEIIKTWMGRDETRRVKIKITKGKKTYELEFHPSMTPEEIKEYIDSILN